MVLTVFIDSNTIIHTYITKVIHLNSKRIRCGFKIKSVFPTFTGFLLLYFPVSMIEISATFVSCYHLTRLQVKPPLIGTIANQHLSYQNCVVYAYQIIYLFVFGVFVYLYQICLFFYSYQIISFFVYSYHFFICLSITFSRIRYSCSYQIRLLVYSYLIRLFVTN